MMMKQLSLSEHPCGKTIGNTSLKSSCRSFVTMIKKDRSRGRYFDDDETIIPV